MAAYYNEIDPFAASWLRELIKAGHIAPGEVDTRSIEDVVPDDLRGFTQCHFFAGIGVWSYALRLAGWPDDRPVWTGSCPCQPFSAAGKGAGFADERHLWPALHHLVRVCRPPVVFGEQVASKDGLAWFDLVQADMEGEGYSCGVVDSCSAGFGAPHIRQRLYWVADAIGAGLEGRLGPGNLELQGSQRQDGPASETGLPCGLVNPTSGRLLGSTVRDGEPLEARRAEEQDHNGVSCEGRTIACGVADDYSPGLQPWERDDQTERYWNTVAAKSLPNRHGQSRPTNGFWGAADWLLCRDGKWRPVEPGTFPLVNGTFNRMGRLRGYGNAINAQQAKEFITAYMAINKEKRP